MNKAHEAETPATGHAEREAFEKWCVKHISDIPEDWPLIEGQGDESRYAFLAWQAGRAELLAKIRAGGERAYEDKYGSLVSVPAHEKHGVGFYPLYRLSEGE